MPFGGGAAALPVATRIATEQTYPARPITPVVPVAGGAGDTAACIMLSEKLQENLKQPVAAENRPGAGSKIGNGARMYARNVCECTQLTENDRLRTDPFGGLMCELCRRGFIRGAAAACARYNLTCNC